MVKSLAGQILGSREGSINFFPSIGISLLLLLGAPQLCAQGEAPPNLVLILADDLGWRDLRCMGSQYHETTYLDQLAAQRLRFTQAYAEPPGKMGFGRDTS
jgi:hypothetical protein